MRKASNTAKARSYDQFCALALALDKVGERWALLVVRELLAGPRRFSDLLAGMPGVATNILTVRLEQLEAQGLVRWEKLPPPAASTVYSLTERGRALEPVVLAFAKWGQAEVAAVRKDPRRAQALAGARSNWLALGLRANFQPRGRGKGRLQLDLPTGTLGLEVQGEELALTYGALSNPQATLALDEETLILLLTSELAFEAAVKSGRARLTGEAPSAKRVLERVAFRRG